MRYLTSGCLPNSMSKCSKDSNKGFIASGPNSRTSPQQRASPLRLSRDPLPGRFKGANDSVAALLQSWRGSPRLLFVSTPENSHERTLFRDRNSWQSQSALHHGSKRHSRKGLPWRLWCLEISLVAMYRHRRSLFWNLLMCCTDLFNKFCLIDSLTLLFRRTMYIFIECGYLSNFKGCLPVNNKSKECFYPFSGILFITSYLHSGNASHLFLHIFTLHVSNLSCVSRGWKSVAIGFFNTNNRVRSQGMNIVGFRKNKKEGKKWSSRIISQNIYTETKRVTGMNQISLALIKHFDLEFEFLLSFTGYLITCIMHVILLKLYYGCSGLIHPWMLTGVYLPHPELLIFPYYNSSNVYNLVLFEALTFWKVIKYLNYYFNVSWIKNILT